MTKSWVALWQGITARSYPPARIRVKTPATGFNRLDLVLNCNCHAKKTLRTGQWWRPNYSESDRNAAGTESVVPSNICATKTNMDNTCKHQSLGRSKKMNAMVSPQQMT